MALYLYWNPICGVHTPHYTDKNEYLLLLLLFFETKRSTPFTQKGVAKLTKMNIYYSFCSILRPKGVLLLLNTITKRSTPSTQKGVPKMTEMNIYYSFCSILRLKGVLLLLNTIRSTSLAAFSLTTPATSCCATAGTGGSSSSVRRWSLSR